VSVRVGGGVSAGRAARGGRGRGARGAHQTGSHEQEAATRWSVPAATHAAPRHLKKNTSCYDCEVFNHTKAIATRTKSYTYNLLHIRQCVHCHGSSL
jgi:hypothetical protein